MMSRSTTAYVFEGDSSLGYKGQGQVFDRNEPMVELPYMYEDVNSVMLKDVSDEILEDKKAKDSKIVLKLDIGSYECDVLAADENVFLDMEIKGYRIVM